MKVDLFFLRLPIIDDIFNNHPLFTYVAFISLFVVHLLMYHTKFGTYVRVVGENPEAAKAVGISVDKVKYLAIIIGAVMSGLAGINVAIEQLSSYTPDITAGIGFIAIAAIYCGSGSPLKSGAYAILFGLMRALAINLSLRIGAIAGLLEVIPYITIVIVLTAVAVKRIRKSNLRGFAHE